MNQKIKIGKKTISDHGSVFIIAEAGVNHNGDLKLAKKLIDMAKEAGADAVKFQTFLPEELVTKHAAKAKYQRKASDDGSQYEMLKKLQLSSSDFKMLFQYCQKRKIIFLSTPFDFQSARFLNQLNVPAFKIGSGDMNNLPLLSQIAGYKKPIILSTGMSTLTEVKEAYRTIQARGNRKIILLHCTSNYPTKFEDVNLNAMLTLKNTFPSIIGCSDHTLGIEVPIAAVALGARIIEKHLTLDRKLPGPDHKTSLNPEEFQMMVESIRNIEKAKGNIKKEPNKSEIEISKVIRKSIIAARSISRDSLLTTKMLTIKRPGTGIKPKYFNRLIGRKVKKNISKDHILQWNEVI